MRPRILICASTAELNTAVPYEDAVRAAGGDPVSRYCSEVDLSFDGLLLTGGGDIEPCRYGQETTRSVAIRPERDQAELALCRAYLEAGKPILGICRGHQIINVALGGTMIQDLGEFLNRFHRRSRGSDLYKAHTIWAEEGSALRSLYGEQFSVNSSHHQAVDRLGNGLIVTARSETGIVESLELPGKPVLGVQFHPERMTGEHLRPDCVDGVCVFRWLIDRCREQ